jgi:toxin-antitoxin system PIN domain toxin
LIVPDLNLIIYAHNRVSPLHAGAKSWWEAAVDGTETVGLPWVVTTGFIRIITTKGLADPPFTMSLALHLVNQWFSYPAVQPIEPGPHHLRHLSDLLSQVQVGGKLVTDAHLAAIAIEHRAALHTHDRDFERFSGLRLYDPL